MIVTDFFAVFGNVIKGNNDESNGYIEHPNKSTSSVDTVVSVFQGASSTPTYDELVAIDGGIKGYIPFFDQCKADGILN